MFLGEILKVCQLHLSEIKFTKYLFYAEVQFIEFSYKYFSLIQIHHYNTIKNVIF